MAGAGYKLFNTGDVLTAAQVNTYLMEQTVMVFADAAARTAALSGVVSEGMISYLKDTNAVEVYNGSAWVASDDPNAIQNTIVDAKGDLIAASAADTPARLAVGSDGDTLLADSAASTGLRWQGNFAAGKNKILNSDFSIWQRGTSFSTSVFSGGLYTADRWSPYANGTGATRTISQQTFTAGTAPVSGYEGTYFMRIDTSVAGSGNTYVAQNQRVEDVRTFAGQTVTLSFFAKASASATVTTGLSQNFGSGGSASVDTVPSGSASLTTSWQRFSFTATLPSISGKTLGSGNFLEVQLRLPAAATFTIDIWGIQLEAGNVATAFQTATGTLAGELAACERYYKRYSANNVGLRVPSYGGALNSTNAYITIETNLRTTPTTLDYSGLSVYDGVTVTALSAAPVLNGDSTARGAVINCPVASGLTATRGYQIVGAANTGYIGIGAEL